MKTKAAKSTKLGNKVIAARRAANGGYHDCPCRDCFEIAIGCDEYGNPDLCTECEEAGCSADGDCECCAEGAYGQGGEEGPEDGDITTTDHATFYQYGKRVLTLDHDLDQDGMKAALREFCERAKFWPNVWFVSDHGNAHLIEL